MRKPEYRAPFDAAAVALPVIATQARDLAAEDKPGRDALAALAELITLKMASMRSGLERADAGDFEAAMALLDSPQAHEIDARTSTAFDSMAKRNTAALADRAARWEDSLDASRSGILAVVGLNAALIALLCVIREPSKDVPTPRPPRQPGTGRTVGHCQRRKVRR